MRIDSISFGSQNHKNRKPRGISVQDKVECVEKYFPTIKDYRHDLYTRIKQGDLVDDITSYNDHLYSAYVVPKGVWFDPERDGAEEDYSFFYDMAAAELPQDLSECAERLGVDENGLEKLKALKITQEIVRKATQGLPALTDRELYQLYDEIILPLEECPDPIVQGEIETIAEALNPNQRELIINPEFMGDETLYRIGRDAQDEALEELAKVSSELKKRGLNPEDNPVTKARRAETTVFELSDKDNAETFEQFMKINKTVKKTMALIEKKGWIDEDATYEEYEKMQNRVRESVVKYSRKAPKNLSSKMFTKKFIKKFLAAMKKAEENGNNFLS